MRPIRRAFLGVAFGGVLILPGRILLALLYFAINIAVTFTNVNWSSQTLFAKRLGWIALCNLCLVVLLGLKKTPLLPLTGFSYESLNVLHRCCGYTLILLVVLHAAIYATGLAKSDAPYVLRAGPQYAAAVAGISMIIILATAVTQLRKWGYEAFYTIHVTLVAVILITAGIHTFQPPDISPRVLIIITLAAGLWVVDRLLRLVHWLYYGFGNYCTLKALPENATRVTMHRSIAARPGSHVFLYIPSVRAMQNHPFTLLSSEPAEFVIAAKDGFTKALYESACTYGSKTRYRAAVEGPYGNASDARSYDKIVLVAGGAGATFTVAIALHWSRSLRTRKRKSTLDFVWTVKSEAYHEWFEDELAELRANPAVNVTVYITRGSMIHSPRPSDATDAFGKEVEKGGPSTLTSSTASRIRHGRPDITRLVEDIVDGIGEGKRVLLAGSGPDGMLTEVRATASELTRVGRPSLDLHLEAFEW